MKISFGILVSCSVDYNNVISHHICVSLSVIPELTRNFLQAPALVHNRIVEVSHNDSTLKVMM